MELLVRGENAMWDHSDFCPYSDFEESHNSREPDENGVVFEQSAEMQFENLRLIAAQIKAINGV